jgi:hypothetical protein
MGDEKDIGEQLFAPVRGIGAYYREIKAALGSQRRQKTTNQLNTIPTNDVLKPFGSGLEAATNFILYVDHSAAKPPMFRVCKPLTSFIVQQPSTPPKPGIAVA